MKDRAVWRAGGISVDAGNRWSRDLDVASASTDRGPRTGLVIEQSVIEQSVVDSPMVVLRPVGDLDMLTCPALRARLHAELDHAPQVTVDLTEVTFVASSALQVLLEAHELALSRDGRLRVAGAGRRHLLRPFEITGLDRVLNISTTPAEPRATLDLSSEGSPCSDGESATRGVRQGGHAAGSGEDVA